MPGPRSRSTPSRGQRLRARALWSLSVAVICLAAALIGAVQLVYSGEVSIRPGRPPTNGPAALALLVALGSVGAAFLVFGIVLRRNASQGARLRDTH